MHRFLALGVLAVGMAQVGHVLGYLVAHPSAADRGRALGGHGHMAPLVEVLLPLTLAAVAWLVWMEVRGRWRLRLGSLAIAQAVAFATQEMVESLVSGLGPLAPVHEPAVWVGLGAQVLVAWLAVATVRAGRWAADGRLYGPRRVVLTLLPSVIVPWAGPPIAAPLSLGSISRRGPPS